MQKGAPFVNWKGVRKGYTFLSKMIIKRVQAFRDIGPRSGAFLTVDKTLLSIPGLIKNPVISNASNSVTILPIVHRRVLTSLLCRCLPFERKIRLRWGKYSRPSAPHVNRNWGIFHVLPWHYKFVLLRVFTHIETIHDNRFAQNLGNTTA